DYYCIIWHNSAWVF
nr:immunoglobulin light chain junction region [Macaca mulatta]